jgi:arylsulfatase A-like enzyme
MIEGDPETRSDYFQTPSLERLAEGGRVLSACYSPAPLCAPSRNSLLHGMTPSRMRLTTLSAVEGEEGISRADHDSEGAQAGEP